MGNVSLTGKGNGRRRGVHTWMSNGADCRNRTCFLWGSGGAHECCSCSSLFFRRASRRPQLLLCTPSKRTKSVSSYNTMYPHSKTRICRPHNQKYRRAVTISSWEHRPRYRDNSECTVTTQPGTSAKTSLVGCREEARAMTPVMDVPSVMVGELGSLRHRCSTRTLGMSPESSRRPASV